jgi:predicted Zn-dependent protease
MNKFLPPDSHFFRAAIGWLELGNPREALVELNQIKSEYQSTMEVLEVRWQILAADKNWEEALTTARQLIAANPDQAVGWVHQAYALRRTNKGGLSVACEALLPAADKFPQEPIIPYNLACYAAQMGQLDQAWQWLRRAARIGKASKIKALALADPDLEPLWEKLREDDSALS